MLPRLSFSGTVAVPRASLVSVLVLVAIGGSVRPAVAQGCTSDWNCSLNGHCTSTQVTVLSAHALPACVCTPPWTGPACDVLDVVPSPPSGPAIFPDSPTLSSWGGSVLPWTDGRFHLFVAEMADGCGMVQWETNSRIAHAVSDTMKGPFVRTSLAAEAWAHNPQAIAIGGELFLFHIGAAAGNTTLVNCTPGSRGDGAGTVEWERRFDPHVTFIQSAPSPEGPWTRLPDGPFCDNPSPLPLRNGTLLLMCSRSVGHVYPSRPHWRLYTAESPRGPWRVVTEITPEDTTINDAAEDPFLWEDQAGHLHVLAHAGPLGHEAGEPSPRVSAHGFSRDGVTWGWSVNQPYSSTIVFENGSSVHFSSAERPKLVLDEDGAPTHLVNGLSAALWPCDGCPQKNYTNVCNKCKLTPHVDHTYTIARGLRVATPSADVNLPNTSLATLPVVYLGGTSTPRTAADITRLSKLRAVAIEKWEGPCWDGCLANQSKHIPCVPSCAEEEHQMATLASIRALNAATVTIMYFNSFLDFEYYSVHAMLVARGLLLRDVNNKTVVLSNDNNMNVTVPDFSHQETVDLWMEVMTNATATGFVDGFYADKYGVTIEKRPRGWIVSNHNVDCVIPEAVAIAWNAGHQQLLSRMVSKFGPRSMLLHLTTLLPQSDWKKHMTPLQIYHQLASWSSNRTAAQPYAWIHPWGDDKVAGTVSLCDDDDIVGFLLGVEEGAFLSCQGWAEQFAFPLGNPLGPATMNSSSLTRTFTSGTRVTYNQATSAASLVWGSSPA